jgi:hypothetical protein
MRVKLQDGELAAVPQAIAILEPVRRSAPSSSEIGMPADNFDHDQALDARLDALCAEGWALFEEFDLRVRDREFHPFVAADYEAVRAALVRYRAPGQRFLEFGSATGVITIMADMLGFDAAGIEIDSSLVRTAQRLAERFGSRARFVTGSFMPTGYRWRSPVANEFSSTTGEGASGYLQLGAALDDFDVVFGYPWGGEAPMMLDLMRQFGRKDALLLLNDTTTGVHCYRNGKEVVTAP